MDDSGFLVHRSVLPRGLWQVGRANWIEKAQGEQHQGVPGSAERQLDAFIGKYTPEIGFLAQAALAKMRARLSGAVQLVYENYNALAIGFGPTDRTSDVMVSITLYPRWVSLFFRRGASLPDPQKLLKGSGTTVRHIVLEDAADLDKPAVRTLIDLALKNVIKLVSAKQRPRR